ncbi:1-aminocyclopropane-1-carboxylate oxidase homolog 1-like [Fagus crenata]
MSLRSITGIWRWVKSEFDVSHESSFVCIANIDSTKVVFYGKAANWRDTLFSTIAPDAPNPEELPAACRDNVKRLGVTLLELLSEALGLKPNHLIEMECAVVQDLGSHYFPACPEPNKHTQILISSLFFYKTKLEASKLFIKISGKY